MTDNAPTPGSDLFAELVEQHKYLGENPGVSKEAAGVAVKTLAEYANILDAPASAALEQVVRGLASLAVGIIGHTERLRRLDAEVADLKGQEPPEDDGYRPAGYL